MLGIAKVADIEGVPVYETPHLGCGYGSAGLCLPGIGIFVGQGTYEADVDVVRHEFGHILQARTIGFLSFYLIVGLMSLMSAWTNGYGKGHQLYWTELWCNYVAKNYFEYSCQEKWNTNRFPVQNISDQTLRWIRWRL